MILFPAIDIKDGKVVRLKQGKFDEVTVYSVDPVKTAKEWAGLGAQWLHVVDLDGALKGELKNKSIIFDIARNVPIPVQTGGGIRTAQDVEEILTGGVQRIILGTKAIADRKFLKKLLQKWPDQIAVSVDCLNGKVAQRGWTEVSNINAIDLAKELKDLGLRCLIYTDISRDGMLSGPNVEALEELLTVVRIPVIASGGLSSLQDIKRLITLEKQGLIGAITGKAIYEGKFDLREALKICSQNG
jgi:phosphoribosylformimino-5-aminoimidazole carboxamide ribotide isomerase